MCNGKSERVCQTMFLSTLNISEKTVRTAHEKVGKNGMTISPDKRGTFSKVKDRSHLLARLDEHIRSFEVVSSHFCRKSTKRQYLEPGLSVPQMYVMYKIWIAEMYSEEEVVSERTFHEHFVNKLNYGFYIPRKDQCELCNVYARGTDAFKATIQEKFETHMSENKLAISMKRKDRSDAGKSPEKICFATFDIQKILSTPKDETGLLYYKRKLSTYNFTVVDAAGNDHRVTCYVWNESEGKRGANEIASALMHFLIKTKSLKKDIDEFRFWSDNCYGQNKNKYVFSMMLRTAHKLNIRIVLRFLETGHTMNECDTVHAHIEDAAKHRSVFTSDQWYDIIEKDTLTESKTRCVVERISGKILDFHPLAEKFQKWNRKGGNWKNIREIVFGLTKPQGFISLRSSLAHAAPVKEVDVSLPSVPGRPRVFSSTPLSLAYHGKLQVPMKKLKDLATLCEKQIIPEVFHSFYKALPGITLEGGAPATQELAGSEVEGDWQLDGLKEPAEDFECALKVFTSKNDK